MFIQRVKAEFKGMDFKTMTDTKEKELGITYTCKEKAVGYISLALLMVGLLFSTVVFIKDNVAQGLAFVAVVLGMVGVLVNLTDARNRRIKELLNKIK